MKIERYDIKKLESYIQDIADYYGMSKTSILRRRDAIIRRLAVLIGYV